MSMKRKDHYFITQPAYQEFKEQGYLGFPAYSVIPFLHGRKQTKKVKQPKRRFVNLIKINKLNPNDVPYHNERILNKQGKYIERLFASRKFAKKQTKKFQNFKYFQPHFLTVKEVDDWFSDDDE